MSVAVVTGVAGGIGGVLARRLAQDHRIVAVDIAEGLHDVVASLVADGLDVVGVRADLTTQNGVAAVVQEAGPEVSLLVNNAGITRDARLINMTQEQFESVIAVNLGAVYRLSRAIAPSLMTGGSVVSMSSRAYLGNFGQFNYSMSKGGVIGLTRALAVELAPHARANAIAPGLIQTPMSMAIPVDIRTKMVASIPMARMGSPEDIAEAVAWLGNPELSGYVTGEVIGVGGGRSLI